MKDEHEIKARLNDSEKQRKKFHSLMCATDPNDDEYDEVIKDIVLLDIEISALKWVLN